MIDQTIDTASETKQTANHEAKHEMQILLDILKNKWRFMISIDTRYYVICWWYGVSHENNDKCKKQQDRR